LFPLKALYPGDVNKLRSLTAAALLRFWKMVPLWSYPGDYHGSKNLEQALSRIAPNSDANHYWGNVHLTSTLLLAHEVFNKWVATESYKLFDSYESATSGKSISARKLKRRIIKLLSHKERRTKLNDPAFVNNLNRWIDSGVLANSLKNSTMFRYVQNQHSYVSESEKMDITELYPGYPEVLNEMRQWLVVEIKDVWLDTRDKIDNQMVLGIEKAFKELNLPEDQLTALYEWSLTQQSLI
jgi:hypothetical protein